MYAMQQQCIIFCMLDSMTYNQVSASITGCRFNTLRAWGSLHKPYLIKITMNFRHTTILFPSRPNSFAIKLLHPPLLGYYLYCKQSWSSQNTCGEKKSWPWKNVHWENMLLCANDLLSWPSNQWTTLQSSMLTKILIPTMDSPPSSM
jgi:hypothetical protein